jgi:hypothetical protein
MGTRIVNRYNEGDLYSFPLQSGGYGVGFVWRVEYGPRYGSRLVLLAGFGRRFAREPSLAMIASEKLAETDIWCCSLYRDTRLLDGTWDRLGILPGYGRDAWPLPLWWCNLTGAIIEFEVESIAESPPLASQGDYSRTEQTMFLSFRGYGTADGLPGHLDLVINNPSHFQRDVITPSRHSPSSYTLPVPRSMLLQLLCILCVLSGPACLATMTSTPALSGDPTNVAPSPTSAPLDMLGNWEQRTSTFANDTTNHLYLARRRNEISTQVTQSHLKRLCADGVPLRCSSGR